LAIHRPPFIDDKEAGYTVRLFELRRTGRLICPTGCSAIFVSSPFCKNISVFTIPKSPLYPVPFRPTEGRIAIVTDAGRNAVDADALLTNGAEADGEVVWS
jgi:hypothetical protein